MSYPSTPVKIKPFVEQEKRELEKTLAKNCNEPNRYLHALRLGICHFKLEAINKIEQPQEYKLIKGLK